MHNFFKCTPGAGSLTSGQSRLRSKGNKFHLQQKCNRNVSICLDLHAGALTIPKPSNGSRGHPQEGIIPQPLINGYHGMASTLGLLFAGKKTCIPGSILHTGALFLKGWAGAAFGYQLVFFSFFCTFIHNIINSRHKNTYIYCILYLYI